MIRYFLFLFLFFDYTLAETTDPREVLVDMWMRQDPDCLEKVMHGTRTHHRHYFHRRDLLRSSPVEAVLRWIQHQFEKKRGHTLSYFLIAPLERSMFWQNLHTLILSKNFHILHYDEIKRSFIIDAKFCSLQGILGVTFCKKKHIVEIFSAPFLKIVFNVHAILSSLYPVSATPRHPVSLESFNTMILDIAQREKAWNPLGGLFLFHKKSFEKYQIKASF